MTAILACPDAEQLQKIALGHLPAPNAAAVMEHIMKCSNCVARLNSMAAVDSVVEAASSSEPSPAGPEQEAVQRLLIRIRGLVNETKGGRADQTQDLPTPKSASDTPFFSWVDSPGEAVAEDDGLAPPKGPDELGWLGPYRIIKVLGEGGMGKVFLAEDPALQRQVALKVMKKSLARNLNSRKRFLQEARTAAKIEHDHIIHIYQVGEDRGIPFLAMPLLKGLSLEDFLRRSAPLKLKQTLRIGIQIARGLEAAHASNLIHRDIKPGNIWIEPTGGGRVKILDFGLARTTESESGLTQSGAILGTPAYMPPEQARGEKVDHRADLYSLGCVLYRMTTGELPLKGNDTMALLMALAMHEPTAPRLVRPEIPQSLSDLIMSLLAKDPARRPNSATEVLHALNAIESENFATAKGDSAISSASLLQSAAPAPLVQDLDSSEATNPVISIKANAQKADATPSSRANADAIRGRGRRPALLIACAAVAAFLLLLGAGGIAYHFSFQTAHGTLHVAVDDKEAEVRFKAGWLEIRDPKTDKVIYKLTPSDKNKHLPPGDYLIEVVGADGLKLSTKEFSLSRNGERTVHVSVAPNAVAQQGSAPLNDKDKKPNTVRKVPLSPAPYLFHKPASLDHPFVLIREGKIVREFRSIAGAVPELQKGDTIEIHGNGPFEIGITRIGSEGLTLRAAPGFRPRFLMQKDIFGGQPTDLLQVNGGDVYMDGCDFECPAGVHGFLRGEGENWTFRGCRFQIGELFFLVYNGAQLRIADSLILAPTHAGNGTLISGKIGACDWENCIVQSGRILQTFYNEDPSLRFNQCTLDVYALTTLAIKPKRPIDVEVSQCILPSGVGYEIGKKDLFNWRGAHNFYFGDHFSYVQTKANGVQNLDMAGWNRHWGKEEVGSRLVPQVTFAWDEGRSSKTVDAALAVLRARLDQARQQAGSKLVEVGPDWSQIGPGDAYAQTLMEQRKIKKDQLRPEGLVEGSIVLIRKEKPFRGYRSIADAVNAAENNDVVEIRSDGEFRDFAFGPNKKRTITLRAGPGYRPVINGLGYIGKNSDWTVAFEGIEFRNTQFQFWDNPKFTISRLANCSFLPRLFPAAGSVLFHDCDGKPVEIVNCLMPGIIPCDIPPGGQLKIQNSVIGRMGFSLSLAGPKERSVDLDRCVVDCTPVLGGSLANGPAALTYGTRQGTKASIAFGARRTFFEAPLGLVWGTADVKLTKWTGAGNLYRKMAGPWFFPASASQIDIDLADVRGQWKSDADSVSVATPPLLDPKQWRLLPGSNVEGKAYGAEIDRVAATPPS